MGFLEKILSSKFSKAINLIMAFISGLTTSLMLPDFNFIICGFIGFSVFYFLLYKCNSNKDAFFCGWLFGFGYFLLSLSWVGNALLVEGNPYKWAYPLAVAGLPFILSFYFGITSLLIKSFAKLDKLSGLFLFTLIFGIGEFLRGHLFTGFPWNLFAFGWSQYLEILQIVNFINVYGLTFISIFWFSFAGFILIKETKLMHKSIVLAIALVSFGSIFFYGYSKLKNSNEATQPPNITIALVQASIPQSEKWKPNLVWDNFNKYIDISKKITHTEDHPLIIIWPETTYHFALYSNETAKDKISKLLSIYNSEAYLITGALRNSPAGFSNDFIIFNSDGDIIDTYTKTHLVPFGEYMPFKNLLELTPISNFKGLVKGDGLKDIKISQSIPAFSPLICYEIIFPGKVTASKGKATWIINLTNDAWYGESAGPYQHFEQARFRAIEENAVVIRSASTGISAIINNDGNIINYMGINKDGFIKSSLYLRSKF